MKLAQPHPLLSDLIERYFYMDVDFSEPEAPPNEYCFLPDYKRGILFILSDRLRADTQKAGPQVVPHDVGIIGPQLTPVQLCLGRHYRMLAVILKPGGLYRLLGIPMHELVEDSLPGYDVMGPETRPLCERLKHVFEADEIFRLADAYFIRKRTATRALSAIDRVMQNIAAGPPGLMTVEQAASAACFSNRQFERHCLQRLGLSPKLYMRLIRFSKATAMKERQPLAGWTEIACAAGYFDQNHFIRDFKQFAGFTPAFFAHGPQRRLAFHRDFEYGDGEC